MIDQVKNQDPALPFFEYLPYNNLVLQNFSASSLFFSSKLEEERIVEATGVALKTSGYPGFPAEPEEWDQEDI